jgi:hypothetical protein
LLKSPPEITKLTRGTARGLSVSGGLLWILSYEFLKILCVLYKIK